MSAGRRHRRAGLRCTNKTGGADCDFSDVKLSFQVRKPGVLGVLENRWHLHGDVVNRILGVVGHGAAEQKLRLQLLKKKKVEPQSLSPLSSP